MATLNTELKKLEESLLLVLSQSEGPIVENTELIRTLEITKTKASETNEKITMLKTT